MKTVIPATRIIPRGKDGVSTMVRVCFPSFGPRKLAIIIAKMASEKKSKGKFQVSVLTLNKQMVVEEPEVSSSCEETPTSNS